MKSYFSASRIPQSASAGPSPFPIATMAESPASRARAITISRSESNRSPSRCACESTNIEKSCGDSRPRLSGRAKLGGFAPVPGRNLASLFSARFLLIENLQRVRISFQERFIVIGITDKMFISPNCLNAMFVRNTGAEKPVVSQVVVGHQKQFNGMPVWQVVVVGEQEENHGFPHCDRQNNVFLGNGQIELGFFLVRSHGPTWR